MMLLPHINNVLPLFEKVKVYEEIIIQLEILSHKYIQLLLIIKIEADML